MWWGESRRRTPHINLFSKALSYEKLCSQIITSDDLLLPSLFIVVIFELLKESAYKDKHRRINLQASLSKQLQASPNKQDHLFNVFVALLCARQVKNMLMA